MFEYSHDTFRVILYTFSFLLFLWYFIILKSRRDPCLVKFSNTLPGPPGLPLVGNTLPFVFSGLGKCFYYYYYHYFLTGIILNLISLLT